MYREVCYVAFNLMWFALAYAIGAPCYTYFFMAAVTLLSFSYNER